MRALFPLRYPTISDTEYFGGILTSIWIWSRQHSASIIFQYAEKACQAKTADRSIDLRTTTPIDMDVDGNGIVESQENMAADSKQGENERSQPEETIPLHGGKLKHIR